MNSRKNQNRFLLLSVLLILMTFSARSQNSTVSPYYSLHNLLSQTYLPSPNATELGKYGDIPISHHTGKANVTIPLYSIPVRDITLDKSLDYDTSGLQMHQLPGWTGYGWTLSAGGCITRTVNYFADEIVDDRYPYSFLINYFNAYNMIPPPGEEESSAYSSFAGKNRDFMPDMFYFNFMGKTGYFLLGNDGNWKVYSESNLTVAFDISDSNNYGDPFYKNYYCDTNEPMPKTIKGFTLIDDDGTRYEFGGTTDAIEYSTDLFHLSEGDTSMPWISTSWYLRKVSDRFGKTLFEFHYARNYFLVQLGYVEYSEYYGNSLETHSGFGDTYTGTLNAPVYLKSVTTENGMKLIFNFSNPYPEEQLSKIIYPSFYNSSSGIQNGTLESAYYMLRDKSMDRTSFVFLQNTSAPEINECQAPTNSNRQTDPLSSIGLRVLTGVTLINTEDNSRGKKYHFNYDQTGRLHLGSIDVNMDSSSYEGLYILTYQNYDKIPSDCLSQRIDHWGYYRRYNAVSSDPLLEAVQSSEFPESLPLQMGKPRLQSLDSLRSSDPVSTQYGMLVSIEYPTGGCSKIEYEQNDYSGCVSADRQSIIQISGYAGGLRVKSIAEYESVTSSTPLKKRTYTYKNPDNQTSSGILFSLPQYYYLWKSKDVNNGTIRISTFKSTPIRPLSNHFSPPVGYSYISETNLDGSKTVFHYSNMQDYHDSPFVYTKMQEGESPFDMFCERGYKRGRLLHSATYNTEGSMMASVENSYRSEGAEDYYVYASNMVLHADGLHYGSTFHSGGTYKIFYPKYDLERSVKSIRHGNVLLSDTIYYTYLYDDTLSYRYDNKPYRANISKLASVANKRGEVRTDDIYTYPLEESVFTDGYYLPATSLESRQNNNVQVRKETVYGIFNGKLHPQYDIAYIGTSTVPDTLVSYLSYTVNGRLREYVSKGESKTTLLWDSNDRLVARVQGDINPDSLEYIKVYPMMEGEDEPVIDMMNDVDYQFFLKYNGTDIFSYPNVSAEVYGYNYKGNPVYIQSGNGVAKHYSYDRDGRLTETMDADWETKSSFDYNYSTGHQRPILNP